MADLGAYSLAQLAGCDPDLIAAAHKLADFATQHGGDFTIVSGLRSTEKQSELYSAYLAKLKAGQDTLPAAKPGTSKHEQGRAFDIRVNVPFQGLTVEQTYKALADAAPSFGLRAGYYFSTPDPVHFELSPFLSTRTGQATVVVLVLLAVLALILFMRK